MSTAQQFYAINRDFNNSNLVSPDHRPHTENAFFYRISLGLHTLLESNLGCFQMKPPLSTIVFKAFFVTRQIKLFGFIGFLGFVRLFSETL